MDFSKVGLKEAGKKALNVSLYVLSSMAIIGLGMYVADQSVSWESVKIAMLAGGANVVLAFLQKWTSVIDTDTKK